MRILISLVLLGGVCSGVVHSSTVFPQIWAELRELRAALDLHMPRLLRDSKVDGASVGVVYRGQPALLLAYGRASNTSGAPYTVDTVSQQASTSKPLTAWAVMQLVESGAIGLDEPVERYISWKIPCSPASNFSADGVTVRRLLSHTGGIGLGGYSGYVASVPSTKDALDAEKEYCCLLPGTWAPGEGDTRIVAEPGSGYSYSGGGYHILQLLLEEHYGKDFDVIMKEQVLQPLGMNSSSFMPSWPSPSKLAESRCLVPGSPCANLSDDLGRLPNYVFSASSAAGAYSTARDFATWISAHMSGASHVPLSTSTLDTMLTPAPNSSTHETNSSYVGLGYFLDTVPIKLSNGSSAMSNLAHHGGGNLGWKLMFLINREYGVGFTVHTNGHNGTPVSEATHMFIDWLTGSSNSSI